MDQPTSKTDNIATFTEFDKLTSDYWCTETYQYGAVASAAMAAREDMIKRGITNANELYEQYRLKKGRLFHYAGD